MFTGIIQELGTVVSVKRTNGLVRLSVYAPKASAGTAPLESVAINGVCLTVVSVKNGVLTFELIPETQRVTTLGRVRAGAPVHVESSLLLTDRLNGHLLLGHIDGVGLIVARRQRLGEVILDIRVPEALRRFLVPKGPVAVDGVSLTIGTLARAAFSVHLIPETQRQTTLTGRLKGDTVNLEVDYVAKILWQAADRTRRAGVRQRGIGRRVSSKRVNAGSYRL